MELGEPAGYYPQLGQVFFGVAGTHTLANNEDGYPIRLNSDPPMFQTKKYGSSKTRSLVVYCSFCRKDFPVEHVEVGLNGVAKPRVVQFVPKKCPVCGGNVERRRVKQTIRR